MGDGAPLEAMASTLAAMANTQGGSLVVGVSGPAGTVVGVRDTDQAQDRVLQAALSLEPPLIIPLPRVIRMNEACRCRRYPAGDAAPVRPRWPLPLPPERRKCRPQAP
jgi:hypothetical protein